MCCVISEEFEESEGGAEEEEEERTHLSFLSAGKTDSVWRIFLEKSSSAPHIHFFFIVPRFERDRDRGAGGDEEAWHDPRASGTRPRWANGTARGDRGGNTERSPRFSYGGTLGFYFTDVISETGIQPISNS